MTQAAQAILDHFDAVRVISLPSRIDRRQEITAQFAAIGLELGGLRVKIHDAARFDQPGGFPSAGAKGCFHSHLEVLQEARAAGIGRMLVLEDDADFAAPEQLVAALDALSDVNFSIFYGGYQGVDMPSADSPLTQVSPDAYVGATHCMGWSSEAISKAIPFLMDLLGREPGSPDGGPMPVDGAFNWLRQAHPELAVFLATPAIAQQRSSRTDIGRLAFYDRVSPLRQLASSYRRWRRNR